MKIVHLSSDKKFMPLAQSLFEEAFPGQNRYLLARLRRGDRRHATPGPQVSHHGSFYFRTRLIGLQIAAAQCVVVHSMSSRFAPALRHVRPDCLVVWLSGGGDYMPLLEPHLGELFLPRTSELLHRLKGTAGERGRRGPWARLRSWLRSRIAGGKPERRKPPPIFAVAHRVDVFSANPVDAVMMRDVLPSLRAALHVIPSFTVEDVFAAGAQAMAGPDVLLGNSANPTNNHLEALELLRTRLPHGSRVLAPLSYGVAPQGYAQAVAEAGRGVLGEHFEPLTDWLPIKTYNARLARCGVVFMNHRRQQAVGNICAALYRGASVYLRRDNPLYGFFTDLGITLLPIDALEADPTAPLSSLSTEQLLRNRAAIEARYGRARVVAAIRALEGFRR
jgi:dTDP-N-acetylfucosamine:lipid II N-acetylfucosaminyltransferase